MKKSNLFLALCILCFATACKKDKEDDKDGINGNNNNPPTSYTLSITGSSGYFASNPANVSYNPDEASEVFYGVYKSQLQGTSVRARTSGNLLLDLLVYFNGNVGTGEKQIVHNGSYPQSDLFLITDNGNFVLTVTFPEHTPVNISTYGGVNGIIEGQISGDFAHKEIVTSPSNTTEYTAPINLKFRVKRSE